MRVTRFQRTLRIESRIPAVAMANLVFLLFIFFMVTAIFRLEEGGAVTLPRGTMGEELPSGRTADVWIDRDGMVAVDEKAVRMDELAGILASKLQQHPDMIVAFHGDEHVEYALVARALDAARSAGVSPISFTIRADPD